MMQEFASVLYDIIPPTPNRVYNHLYSRFYDVIAPEEELYQEQSFESEEIPDFIQEAQDWREVIQEKYEDREEIEHFTRLSYDEYMNVSVAVNDGEEEEEEDDDKTVDYNYESDSFSYDYYDYIERSSSEDDEDTVVPEYNSDVAVQSNLKPSLREQEAMPNMDFLREISSYSRLVAQI